MALEAESRPRPSPVDAELEAMQFVPLANETERAIQERAAQALKRVDRDGRPKLARARKIAAEQRQPSE